MSLGRGLEASPVSQLENGMPRGSSTPFKLQIADETLELERPKIPSMRECQDQRDVND